MHEALLAKKPSLLEGVRRTVLNQSLPLPMPGAPEPACSGLVEPGFLPTMGEAAVGDDVQRIEDPLDGMIDRAVDFYLLAEAVPARGTLC